MLYGYCRVSTNKQNIERQERNILEAFPQAHIIKEAYTGTKIYERKEFNKLLKTAKRGDTIIFDSVSRMSRSAEDGIKLYFDLFEKGIDLIFIKEPYINTTAYKKAIDNSIEAVGNAIADIYINATNQVIKLLAENQIKIAFNQAEKEVADLHKKTAEGLLTAKMNGKQIGLEKGTKLTTKKSIAAKEQIKKYSKDFYGGLNDIDCMKICGIAKNTYYKYKKEITAELNK